MFAYRSRSSYRVCFASVSLDGVGLAVVHNNYLILQAQDYG